MLLRSFAGKSGRIKMPKSPLYRKVNTLARGVHHRIGGSYRHERNTKKELRSDASRTSMHGKVKRGLDYTPLFRFLLSRVGVEWDQVYSEAVSRLDQSAPIFWLVALHEHEREDFVCIGESSYYSGLYVDANGRLQKVNPAIGPDSLLPHCKCCTHTFNGQPFVRRFGGILPGVQLAADMQPDPSFKRTLDGAA